MEPIISEEDQKVITAFFDRFPQLKNNSTKIVHQMIRPKEKLKFEVPDFSDDAPIASETDIQLINELYKNNPQLNPVINTPEEQQIISEYNKKNYIIFNNAWIQTHTGKKFYPLDPKEEDIHIDDIARGLSNQCRFTGQCYNFYSIAQHCVLVSYLVGKTEQFQALMHDASEAYICDVSSPIKQTQDFAGYRKIEKQIQSAIYRKYGLPEIEHPSIKEADLRILSTEARDLFQSIHPDWNNKYEPYPFRIDPLPPMEARKLFLNRFYELYDATLIK